MALFGALEQELRLDKSQFSRELSEAEREMESVDDQAESTGSRFSGMGEQMKSAGTALTMGVTAPMAAVGAMSLQTASDAEEMQSKMSVVFGESEEEIRQWAAAQEEATGITELQWQEYATTLADTFKPMGFAQDEANAMSKEVTSLAVDLASFNNMPTTEALDRLRGGLVGNHENLEAFGVMITQANLEEKLEGMFGVGADAATEMQKAQARLQMVTEGTTDAQGDAARTSESFANQMKALKGQLREAGVEIGNTLMPVMKPLVAAAGDAVNWFASLGQETKTFIVIMAGLAAALGPVLAGIGILLTLPVTGTMVAIGAAVVGVTSLIVAFRKQIWNAIEPVVEFGQELLSLAQLFAGRVLDNWSMFSDAVMGDATEMMAHLRSVIGNGMDLIRAIFTGDLDLLKSAWSGLVDNLKLAAAAGMEALRNTMVFGMSSIVLAIGQTFGQTPMKIASAFADIINVVYSGLAGIILRLLGFKDRSKQQFSNAFGAWQNLAQIHLPAIGEIIMGALRAALQWILSTGLPLAKAAMLRLLTTIVNTLSSLARRLPDIISQSIHKGVAWLSGPGISLAKKAFRMLIEANIRVWSELVDRLPPLLKKGFSMAITWLRNNGPGMAKKVFTLIGKGIRTSILVFIGAHGILIGLLIDFVKFAVNYLKTDALGDLKAAAEFLFDGFVTVAKMTLEALTPPDGIIAQIIGAIVSYLKNDALGDLKAAAEFLFDVVIAAAEGLYDGLIGNSVIPEMFSDIASYIRNDARSDLSSAADRLFRRLKSDFKSAGKGMIDGFINGIKSKKNAIGRAVSGAVQKARDMLPGSDAKEGPLSDLTDSGEALSETVAEGMENNLRALEGSSTAVAHAANPAMAGGSARGGGGAHIEIYVDGSKSPAETARAIERKLSQAGVNSWRA